MIIATAALVLPAIIGFIIYKKKTGWVKGKQAQVQGGLNGEMERDFSKAQGNTGEYTSTTTTNKDSDSLLSSDGSSTESINSSTQLIKRNS